MNKTKKRAAKRSSLRVKEFRWPFPLDYSNKMNNLRAYRDAHGCTAAVARDAINEVMIALKVIPRRPSRRPLPYI